MLALRRIEQVCITKLEIQKRIHFNSLLKLGLLLIQRLVVS